MINIVAFDQKYTKQKVIGQGAFGEAWLVVEKATKKKLVMKKLISRGMNEAEKKMAKNEIQVLKKCVHENIVRYIDDFYEKGEIFFLMEFCPGRRLVLVKFIREAFNKEKNKKCGFFVIKGSKTG